MKKPRRIFPPIIIILILALILAGCQGNTDVPSPTIQPTVPGPTKPPVVSLPTASPTLAPTATQPGFLSVQASELRGQEVMFWQPWHGDLDMRTREAVDRFNRENEWGIKVSARSFYSIGALEEALQAALDTQGTAEPQTQDSAAPDVVAAPPADLAVLAEAGRVVDLVNYVNHPLWGISADEIKAYQPQFWAEDVRGEQRLGIPLLRTGRVLVYNASWAKELGFPNPPTTPEEFRQQACAAAVKNNQSGYLEYFGTGGWLIDTDALTGLSWLSAFGAEVGPRAAEPAGPGKSYSFESEEGEKAVAFLSDLLGNGCAWIQRSAAPYDDFARRRALFYTATLEDLKVQQTVMESQGLSQNRKDEWTILGFPGVDGKSVVFTSGYSLGLLQNGGGKDNLRKQAAGWLFLRWLSQPAQLSKLVDSWPSFPVSSAVAGMFVDYRLGFPWSLIDPLISAARPAPGDPDWFQARRVLQDATWSIFHLPQDQVETILPQADETLRELLSKP